MRGGITISIVLCVINQNYNSRNFISKQEVKNQFFLPTNQLQF